MSIDLNKTIYEDERYKLFFNFFGLNKDDKLKEEDFSLEIFALDKTTGAQIFDVSLDINSTRELFNHLGSISIISDSNLTKTSRFIEIPDEIETLIDNGKIDLVRAFRKLLNKIDSQERLNQITEILGESELEDLSASITQKLNREALEHIRLLLEAEEEGDVVNVSNSTEVLKKYSSKQPERVFQNWLDNNLWSLGSDYIKKHDKSKISLGSDSDLLLESIDGFLDLIELKRPKEEILLWDESHQCHYPSSKLAQALGQCGHYLKKLDEYKLNLENEYSIKVLKPRIKLIIGRLDLTDRSKTEALRMLNSNLNHIDIIPYDYLVAASKKMIEFYTP